jgi:signal transduction histidine kinase
MNRLLLQLSTGSRAEEALRPLHAAALVERVVRGKTEQRADIRVRSSGEVHILGHEQRWERVIGHLVQNALDATREGGSLEVAVFAEDGRAVLEVADTGCGMSEDFVRERLFRPFQTTKATGMGIGAFETAQYVKEMGGRIEAHSRPGAGTRIRVILPLQQPALQGETARAAA